MLTWLNPGIHIFHGIESLLNLIFFFKSSVWYLSLQAVGVGTLTYVYIQLILFSFSGLQCQIIVSCCCHQLYLAWRNSTLDSHAMSCYFIRKGNLSYFYENMSATINFKLFSFQIGGSNAVGVPEYHSSFGLSTHMSSPISSTLFIWVILSIHSCQVLPHCVILQVK
jgi:hypothetical protein